ncbi:hypothetical protein WT11_30630 [Burkholderia stagnalis]|uniref:polysaccharide lyase n=1 Tax=Burkholderia stagnalis TaxID=1503054 RepID=UPI00075B30AA|nr:polysaccharide lyase [Burkholderia stagnalis]KVN26091.1 hypothetical protein WT11_30630 [Burkholderia stagnalis]
MNDKHGKPFWLRRAASVLGLACVLSTAHAAGPSNELRAGDYRQVYATDYRTRFGELLIQAPNSTDVTATSDPVAPGRRAIRVEMRRSENFSRVANGSPRAEFTLPRDVYLSPGHEYLIRWRTYLPRNFAFDLKQMEIITQIHQSGLSGPPPFMLTLTGAQYTLSVRGGANTAHGSGIAMCCAADDRGKWVDWALQYAPDASGRTAVTRLWKNGVMQFSGDGLPNAYPGDLYAYLKFGVYKPGWLHEPTDIDFIQLYFGEVSLAAKKSGR